MQIKLDRRDSVSLYRFKKLINELESREGKGTELISIYIPPNKPIADIIGYLRQEYATAANIKSKSTRKNVQDAIESAIQRLKLFERAGPTGLVVFSGAIPQDGGVGNEKIEVYHIVPPEPVNLLLYRCDSKFYLEPLKELLKEKDVYGILVIDNEEAAVAVIRGRRVSELKNFTSGVPGKHHAGGQSARRFERLREMNLNEYYKRVAAHANEVFLKYPEIKGIIVAGPGPTKEKFVEKGYLHYTFKDKIHIVDTSYSGREGIREAINRAENFLKELRMVEEQRLVRDLMDEATKENGRAVYGEGEVLRVLRSGLLEILLLSEDLEKSRIKIRCGNCGAEYEYTMDESEKTVKVPELLSKPCERCGQTGLGFVEERPLVDFYIEEAEKAGVRVELISSEHEEGSMLKSAFGGVAGLLKGFT
ncbi:MAG: peptide chain release factor aRF-1 [Nitrososphaeria archaeon]|nr:peptide chain release factor aRF-1 [Aigarchaeota archaeon]MCX8187118.1 peptide chain release factor aRF-1 [Nitrososphaeria archaeon]MDW8021455.1 peptide chain release factor aRF-1 [Nitrososphaerota archaeon]